MSLMPLGENVSQVKVCQGGGLCRCGKWSSVGQMIGKKKGIAALLAPITAAWKQPAVSFSSSSLLIILLSI